MWQSKVKEIVDFKYVTEASEMEAFLNDLEDEKELALDTETYIEEEWIGKVEKAVDPHTSRIAIISIESRELGSYVIDVYELEKAGYDFTPFLDFLERKEKLLAYNAKFDLKMMRKTFGRIFENFWCILLMVKLVTNATGSKFARKCGASLEDVCRDYLNVKLSGKGVEQVSRWATRPVNGDSAAINAFVSKLSYACGDTKYLFQLKDLLTPVLCNPLPRTIFYKEGKRDLDPRNYGLNMAESLELEQEALVALAEMEWNGLPISPTAETFYDTVWSKSHSQNELNRLGGEICKELGLVSNVVVPIDASYEVPISHRILRNPLKLKEAIRKATDLDIDSVQRSFLNRLLDLFKEVEAVKEGDSDQIGWADEEEEECWQEISFLSKGAIREHSKLINLILKYKELDKIQGMSLFRFINPKTGRIHTNFSQLGTSTSRFSSNSPNIQQISGRAHVICRLNKDNPLIQPNA